MVRGLLEPDVADMKFFLEQIQMLFPVLGFSFTQHTPAPKTKPATSGKDAEVVVGKPETVSEDDSPLFYMNPVGTSAIAQEIANELVVLKGSTARKQGVDSWTSYRSLREQLIQDGKLVEDKNPDSLLSTDNVPFSSPSAAAAVVFGGNQNGRKTWKTDDGKTYAEWQEEKLQQADPDQPTGKDN